MSSGKRGEKENIYVENFPHGMIFEYKIKEYLIEVKTSKVHWYMAEKHGYIIQKQYN